MSLPSSGSYTLKDPSSSHIHAFTPPNLTGRIKRIDDQYLAAGSFGDVYRCQYHSQCEVKEVAVKSFRFEFTIEVDVDGRSNRMIRRELGIWKRLIHPNIVPFLGTVSGFGRFGNTSLVSLWMPNGTLQDFLLKYDDKLTVAHRLQALLGIANGLQYLHSLSIVHGDLTCNNVLLDEKHNTRLTDFGYASLVGEIPEGLAYLQASTLRPGAVRWAAPEYFSSDPQEIPHCTTKSDIYSFGNIALQVLSGELPWSEFQRDAVVVLQLAQGQNPRRPQSHPIDDRHWNLIEHCWSSVQERPSAEHLVLTILDFLRSYPLPQPFPSPIVSSEKSNLQSTLSGPLLSPPNIEQFSLNTPLGVPRTFENLHLTAPNRQDDQSPTIGGLSPGIVQCSPQLIPDSNSSTFPLLPRTHRTHQGAEDGHGDEATSQVGHFQSTLATPHKDSGVSVKDTVFPKRPPPAHSKSWAAFPPFLNTSSMGQDHLNIYPFPYPSSQQHSIHPRHSQGTTASVHGNRGTTSGSGSGRGGIWNFLSSHFGALPAPPSNSAPPPPQKQSPRNVVALRSPISFSDANTPQFSFDSASANNMSTCLTPSEEESICLEFLCPRESAIRGQSRRAPSRSRGSGDGTRSALSSNRPAPYPNQTVTNERTASAIYRRRKQVANFLCPVLGCGSTFTRSFNLKGHMKSHIEERPFQCKWPDCGERFTRQRDCKRHEQLHSNCRPSTCEGCNKTFAHMSALRRHLRSESGVECRRILDAARDSEGLPVTKTEDKECPGMSAMV